MPLYTSLTSGVAGLVAYTEAFGVCRLRYTEVFVHYVLNLVHSRDYAPTSTPSVFKV